MPLIITVKVVPQSGRFKLQRDKNGELKCYLVSAPEGGKANRELIKELAKLLKLPQSAITIMMGDTQRKKTLKIDTPCTLPQLYAQLGIEYQTELVP